jgi:hypothetical protein
MKAPAALGLALLALAAACSRPAEENPTLDAAQTGSADVAPPISPPTEGADPSLPPSYEVAIAAAAANRNRAIARCAGQPESVRAQCEQEANSAFAESRASLEDLRGNQE